MKEQKENIHEAQKQIESKDIDLNQLKKKVREVEEERLVLEKEKERLSEEKLIMEKTAKLEEESLKKRIKTHEDYAKQ